MLFLFKKKIDFDSSIETLIFGSSKKNNEIIFISICINNILLKSKSIPILKTLKKKLEI